MVVLEIVVVVDDVVVVVVDDGVVVVVDDVVVVVVIEDFKLLTDVGSTVVFDK